MLSEITPNTQKQVDLFIETVQAEDSNLMSVLDKVNRRYGLGTIKISSQDAGGQWGMRQERKSPAYTTEWDQIPNLF